MLHESPGPAGQPRESNMQLQEPLLFISLQLLTIDEVFVVAAAEEQHVVLGTAGNAVLDEASHRCDARARPDHDDWNGSVLGQTKGGASVLDEGIESHLLRRMHGRWKLAGVVPHVVGAQTQVLAAAH